MDIRIEKPDQPDIDQSVIDFSLNTGRKEKTIDVVEPREPPTDEERWATDWLEMEVQAFREISRDLDMSGCKPPDNWSAERLDAWMKHRGWAGFGTSSYRPDGRRILDIKTERDFTNMEIVCAHYRDVCASMEHYIRWRKRRLHILKRYASEEALTIEDFRIMETKVDSEALASTPTNENLKAAAARVVAEAEKRPDQMHALVAKVTEAREALFAGMKDIGTTYLEFKEATDGIAKELHAFRSSVVTDLAKAKSEMADVRKFFLSHDHETEIARLKEFIGLCHELKALKDSGFLDAVADTILKLEVGK